MSNGPWVRFFASDWLAGTRGMTAAETGIYITLCAMMYERDGYIKDERPRLARLCGASNSAFKKALETLIEDGKIVVEGDRLTNPRVVEELSYSREKSSVASEAAKTRWGKNRNKNNKGDDADAMPAQCDGNANQKPEPEVKEELRSSKRATRLPDDFQPDIAYAISRGLPKDQALIEAEKFRNYWASQPDGKATKKDWSKTWCNWVINSLERRGITPIAAAAPRELTDDDWRKRLRYGRHEEAWFSKPWGPPPGRPGCIVPTHLIEPGDGEGWREIEERNAA